MSNSSEIPMWEVTPSRSVISHMLFKFVGKGTSDTVLTFRDNNVPVGESISGTCRVVPELQSHRIHEKRSPTMNKIEGNGSIRLLSDLALI